MKVGVSINREVQLAFAIAIIAIFPEGTISYRGLVASVESDQWLRHGREALCSGMLEAAPPGAKVVEQTHSGRWAPLDGGCSGGDR